MAAPAPPRFARNLAAVLAWELLWGFGAACTSSSIFVPFLSRLEGSKRLVGTVGLTTLLGIPALFVSLWLAHRLRTKKVAVTLLFVGQVVGWIVLGAALLGGATLSSSIVPVIYVTQAALAFVAGVSMAPTYQLLTTSFGARFGTAQGLQLLFRQASGVAGGIWAAKALAERSFPESFGITFLVGGIVMTGSNVAVLFMVEGDEGPAKTDEPAREPFLPSLRRTLREARSVAPLLVVVTTVALALSAESFMVVSALERLKLPDSYAGVFASVTLAAQGIGGALAGRIGDRIGHARALVGSLAVQVASFALGVTLAGRVQFYVALVLTGVAYAAMQITLAGLTARLAPENSQGAFMAMMRWSLSVASALTTLLAAYTVDHAGYGWLFAGSIVPIVISMGVARVLGRREST
jgi:hypothetical protein